MCLWINVCVWLVEIYIRGIRVGVALLWVLLYADDALLLAESEEELQNMIVSLQESTSSKL
jgi:hypothetical protein